MFGLLRASLALTVGLSVLAGSARVLAQAGPPLPPVYTPGAHPEEPPPETPPPRLPDGPPKLKKFVEATYPPEAQAQNLGATVELEFLIGGDGTVRDVKVVTAAGHGFDEAALEAARQFEFEPAVKNGLPVAARIRFPYVFELKQAAPPEPEPEAPPPPGQLEGQVLGLEDGKPLEGVKVALKSADGTVSQERTTDADGRFVFEGLAAGNYTVHAELKDRQPAEQEEEVRSGEATAVTYRLMLPPDTESFGATARIAPPPREVTRRTINKEELTRIPGTRGDAIRVVELMPGVARPPLGTGLLIIRGSAPNDSQALFEGLPVPILYHFGGLTSFINSRLLDSIEFYPGNFSVRYGRKRGGIIDVRGADPPHDDLHGVADLNLIDASLLVEAPIGKDAEVVAAARRSHIEAILDQALKGQDISTIAAPVYYDYQLMATYRPSSQDKLRLMAFGSSDRLQLLFQQPLDVASSISKFDVTAQFHRLHASWRRHLSDKVDQDIDLAAGYTALGFSLGPAVTFDLKGNDIYQRSEWRAQVTDEVRLIAGLDTFLFPGQVAYSGPAIGQSEGNPNAMNPNFSNSNKISLDRSIFFAQPALYLESNINLAPWLFILGSRVDYYSEIRGYSYDPRGAVHYALTDTTSLKGGVGVFSQPPEPQESTPGLGNPHLKPTHTIHVDTGVEQKLTDAVNIGLDGFYKHLFDRVIGTQFGEAPYFTNGGQGRVYGFELLVRVRPHPSFLSGRFMAYLSYTLSRSERRDRPGDSWNLFDYDQTHILTASGVFRLGKGWEAGATFRFVSGNPNTPVIGANLNTITDDYSAVFGRVNARRDAAFNRLDIRVEKGWTFGSGAKLALYLDVQNVYNAVNAEGVSYDYEFNKHETVRGLPIIPVLGIRGEM